jgi:hypothetical protein
MSYFYGPIGNYYAKPQPLTATPSWGADVVLFVLNTVAVGVDRSYSPASPLDLTLDWVLFRRAGADPAATDEIVASMANQAEVLGLLKEIEEKTSLINEFGQVPSADDFTGSRVSFIGESAKNITVNTDWTETSIYIVWERFGDDSDVLRVDNGDITKTTTTLAIPLTSAIFGRSQFLKYSIRATSGDAVLEQGTWWVRKATL